MVVTGIRLHGTIYYLVSCQKEMLSLGQVCLFLRLAGGPAVDAGNYGALKGPGALGVVWRGKRRVCVLWHSQRRAHSEGSSCGSGRAVLMCLWGCTFMGSVL